MISLFPLSKLCFSLCLNICVRASVRVSPLFGSWPLNWHSALDGEAPITALLRHTAFEFFLQRLSSPLFHPPLTGSGLDSGRSDLISITRTSFHSAGKAAKLLVGLTHGRFADTVCLGTRSRLHTQSIKAKGGNDL